MINLHDILNCWIKIRFRSLMILMGSLAGLLWLSSTNGAELVDRIVAVVNNDIITLVELNEQFHSVEQKIKSMGYPSEKEDQMLFEVREKIINEMIDRLLTDQEIKRANISVSEQEIDATIERMKEANFLTDEKLRQALAQQGISIEQYRKEMKDQILRSKLVTAQVQSKIVITDEDIQAYYESHADAYAGKKIYHLRNIIMRTSSFTSDVQKQRIKLRMQEIREKLDQGVPFAELARDNSEASTASEGGHLGKFEIDSLFPQLQKALQGLGAGEYTSVLETDQGYQIFYVEAIETTMGKSIEEVKPEIEQILYKQNVNQKFNAWIEELRNTAHIKIIK